MLKGDQSQPSSGTTVSSERAGEEIAKGGAHLVCVRCHHRITTERDRIDIGGRHEHRRSNPAGFHFRIGCFASAPGCTLRGEQSSHFTWFRGYSWQPTVCGLCEVHIGWIFRGDAVGSLFYGLILDGLRPEPS